MSVVNRTIHNIDPKLKRRVSHKSKVSGDFKRAKAHIDAIDTFYRSGYNDKKIAKYEINWNLYNGRMNEGLLEDPVSLYMGGEHVQLEQHSITHFNFTSQIARALHGEQKIRPFNPIAKDMGPRAATMRKQSIHNTLSQSLEANIVAPLRETVFQQYMQEYGIQDIRELDPDMQKQLQQDIERRTNALTPPMVLDHYQNEFSTTSERGAQQMLDFLLEYLDVKFVQDEGFKSAIATGEEIYYVGHRNNDVVMDLLNAKHYTWSGSQHTTRYEKGDWGKYEQWFSIDALMQRHAMALDGKDLRELEKYVEPMGGLSGVGNPKYDPIQESVMYDLSDSRNPLQEKFKDAHIGLKHDHDALLGLYGNAIGKYGSTYGTAISNYGIREVHCAWRDKRKLKHVTRRNENTGVKETYWLGEHYTPQPKDIKVQEVWVDQVWEGTKLGTFTEGIFTNVRPVTSQYRSVFDPFNVDLPFYGMAYNTHSNNSENVSCIDLGKPFQAQIDSTMSKIRFDMDTDIGKVFMMDLSMKPENWTWQEFMDSLKTAKIAPINPNQSGGPVDPNAAKSIDMSRMSDIATKMQYLATLREQLVQSMLFNNSRIGAIGEYATNSNTRDNQTASYNQTEDMFDTHRKIVERALNAAVNVGKKIYKDQPHRHEVIFDDVTLAELQTTEDFWYEANGVKISLSSDDIQSVDRIKNLALTLAQNSMTPQSIMELSLAKTPSDVMNIMRKESRKMEAAQQAQQEAQQQMVQAQAAEEAKVRQEGYQHDMRMQAIDNESKERRSMLEASQFERQADVDNNKVADSVERAQIEDERKRDEMALQKIRQEKELELKEREVSVKEKAVNKPKTKNN
jgi:hypothetical protein